MWSRDGSAFRGKPDNQKASDCRSRVGLFFGGKEDQKEDHHFGGGSLEKKANTHVCVCGHRGPPNWSVPLGRVIWARSRLGTIFSLVCLKGFQRTQQFVSHFQALFVVPPIVCVRGVKKVGCLLVA